MARTATRRSRYSRSAGADVKREMRKMKRGSLKSGRSGRKVTSRKQAVAIGLSEARRKGKRVPARGSRTRASGTRRKRTSRSRSR